MTLVFRYWEAIKKFEKAAEYTPHDAKLYEMKAQVNLWVYDYEFGYVLWVMYYEFICVIYNQGWVKRHDMYTWYIFSEFCLNIVKKKILNINTKYRWKHQSILSFLFTLHNSNLLLCLHLLTSSDLFFIKLQSLTEIWWNFSVNFFGNSPFNYWCYMLILQTPNIFWKFGTLHVLFMFKILCLVTPPPSPPHPHFKIISPLLGFSPPPNFLKSYIPHLTSKSAIPSFSN